MAASVRIIGIDPGSRITGYGLVDSNGFRHQYVSSGFLRINGDALPQRLGDIFSRISELIAEWQPEAMAIEKVFVNNNVDSALKLGQARGAAICAAVNAGLEVSEYTPRTIKKAVTGQGAADKDQIRLMMQRLLDLQELPQADEADALAISVCHANHHNVHAAGKLRGVRNGRWV